MSRRIIAIAAAAATLLAGCIQATPSQPPGGSSGPATTTEASTTALEPGPGQTPEATPQIPSPRAAITLTVVGNGIIGGTNDKWAFGARAADVLAFLQANFGKEDGQFTQQCELNSSAPKETVVVYGNLRFFFFGPGADTPSTQREFRSWEYRYADSGTIQVKFPPPLSERPTTNELLKTPGVQGPEGDESGNIWQTQQGITFWNAPSDELSMAWAGDLPPCD